MILCLRTDASEVAVNIYSNGSCVVERQVDMGKKLSDQLLSVIQEVCQDAGCSINDLEAIIVYQGPGSYTGLRIGISVANALAYSSDISIVGANGDDWITKGLRDVKSLKDRFHPVVPIYGGAVHVTTPRK